MDDETRLIAELQLKLNELDNKVAAYREDMANEFRGYAKDLMQHVPAEISRQVGQVISESISSYPSLFPNFDESPRPTSPQSTDDRTWQDGRRSPPPILHHTSGTPKESPRGPRERDNEFLGFITPSYLPLLDGRDRPQHSPSVSPPPIPRSSPAKPDGQASRSITEISQNLVRPGLLKRHTTDNTVSSTESSGNESRNRRSALRRSSSSTKGSPRRVRFSVQGTEVLPTASPQGSHEALGKLPKDGSSATVDDSPLDTSGTSLLDVDGEEDFLPTPKKVSSTEALRALTRNPPEEGTVWTVVNADPDDTGGVNGSDTGVASRDHAPVGTLFGALSTSPATHQSPSSHSESSAAGGPGLSLESAQDEDKEEEEESEEEFLSIGARASRKTPSPKSSSPPRMANAGTTSSDRGAGHASASSDGRITTMAPSDHASSGSQAPTDSTDGEDGFFEFEESDGSTPTPKPLAKHEVQEEEEEAPEDVEREERDTILTASEVERTQNARPPLAGVRVPNPPVASTPPSKYLAEPSIGSYKGTPLRMNPVVNPRLNEELAQQGEFNTFVGGMDGRSGVDSSDLNSFRASVTRPRIGNAGSAALFSGTPGSLSERLMLEEALGGAGDDDGPSLERPAGDLA